MSSETIVYQQGTRGSGLTSSNLSTLNLCSLSSLSYLGHISVHVPLRDPIRLGALGLSGSSISPLAMACLRSFSRRTWSWNEERRGSRGQLSSSFLFRWLSLTFSNMFPSNFLLNR